MAKFKVGDKVQILDGSGRKGEVLDVFDGRCSVGLPGKRVENFSDDVLKISNSLVSSNAVVANALAAKGAVAKNSKDTTIGNTDIYISDDGTISYVLGWRNNEGSISAAGTKDRVIAKAKTDIATLKSKVAEMEKVLAYLQKI